jgi:hypothetical protein
MEGEAMMGRLRSLSPSLVVALIALFVSLGGTAVAAGVVVPLAKRALVANNALKLQGKTAKAVAALAGKPSAGITVKTAPWSLAGNAQGDFTTTCDSGKVISGGYDNPVGGVLALDTRPSSDSKSWKIYLGNLSSTAAASGTLYAICTA